MESTSQLRPGIMGLPYKIHCDIAKILDEPHGQYNWKAFIKHKLPDFTAEDVRNIMELGNKKGESYTEVLLREMNERGYTVEHLKSVLADIPGARKIIQGINEWKKEQQRTGIPLTPSEIKMPIQVSENASTQKRAGTLIWKSSIVQQEPWHSKIPREHDDDTDRPHLNSLPVWPSLRQTNEILCENLAKSTIIAVLCSLKDLLYG